MQAVSQGLLHVAAERMQNSLRMAQEILSDEEAPDETLQGAKRLIAKCDLLLTVAVYRYLRDLALS